MDSPGVPQQITQALIKQRKDILDAALLEVAMNEAKIVNNLAGTMLGNPSNLGLRPASPGAVTSPSASPTVAATQPTSAPATTTGSPAGSPAASPKASASPKR